MPINSSSIPALRVARAVKRRKRAEGGGLFPGLSDGPEGNEGEVMPKGITNPIYSIGKSLLYDLPKRAMEHSAMAPGLRREDFTDVPADTSPDERSAFGGIGVKLPKVGWQPVDPLVGSSLEAASNVVGGSLVAAPVAKAGEAVLGAGAIRRPPAALDDIDQILAAERGLTPHPEPVGVSHEPRPAATAAPEPAAAPIPGEVGPGGGGTAGTRGLEEAVRTAARWAGERKPLEGIPGALKIGEDHFVPGPIGKIHDVAEDYMRAHRPEIAYAPPTRYHPIDQDHSKAIAQAYEEMKHTPKDPATIASYNALIDETAKQYQAIKQTGLKIEPIPAGAPNPYDANPRLAAIDVAENNHLWFFPTEGGFGTVNKITDNPMLRKTGEKIGDHELLANDMFRVVHDYFGHLKQGHGFRAPGEDNAWRTHSTMYSDVARPAMTTETRGQNSNVNFSGKLLHSVVGEAKARELYGDAGRATGAESGLSQRGGISDSQSVPGLQPVAQHDGSMLQSQDRSMGELRGARDNGASADAGPAGVSGRHGTAADRSTSDRPVSGQQRQLRAEERPLGDTQGADQQHPAQHSINAGRKNPNDVGVGGKSGDISAHAVGSPEQVWLDRGAGADASQIEPRWKTITVGEHNRTASGADTIYADQKVGLMPDWTMYDKGKAPIEVFNGSPTPGIEKFSSKFIGSGEGNAAYGQGLYVAGAEPVSERYRHALSVMRDPLLKKYKLDDVGHVIGNHLADAGGDAAKLAQEYRVLRNQLIHGGQTDMATKNAILEYDRRIQFLNDPKRNKGAMYKLALEANPEHILSYDDVMHQQTPYVQERVGPPMEDSVKHQIEAIKTALERNSTNSHPAFAASRTSFRDRPLLPGARAGLEGRLAMLEQAGAGGLKGSEVYKRLGLPAKNETEGSIRSTQRLREMGIPAMKYRDSGSRGLDASAGPTHNFVVFDDNMLRILRRYGIAGIPAAGVLGVDGEERRARGGRIARRLARKAGGGAAFGVMSPAEEAELEEPAPIKIGRAVVHGLGDVAKRSFESSESMRRGEGYDPKPVLEAATLPMGTGAVAGVHAGANQMVLGAGPVRRIADDTGSAMRTARQVKERKYAEPEIAPSGNYIVNKGRDNPPDPSVQTVADPYRMMYPGIYRNPRIIAEEAAAKVGPEDEAMKRLFGVTRGDLREMAKGRVGNEDPRLSLVKNPKGSLSAQNIQTPQNTQRLTDILGEAGKHEGLRTADAWYIMDPVYRRMVELFGPEEAVKRYKMFNTSTAMASPGSDVMTEIQRGTAAHWLQNQGRFDDFKKFAGVPEEFRSRTAHFPQDMRYIGGHPYHMTAQSGPMQKFFDTGAIQSEKPKVPLYAHASGVPETGFQTSGPVGDAHFSRGVGLSDTRKGPTNVQGSFSRPEYQTLQPWWQHEVAGKVGLESVPGQARLWTALGPQTGVDSALGAPKLELLAKQIMQTAKRLYISPEQARDLILSGKAGAGVFGGAMAAPMAMDAMRERSSGGAAMDVARRIKRAKGGAVHVGPITGDTGGRADKRPMEVPDSCYVLTADHVSGLGEGNTEAGMKKLSAMFPKSKPSKLRGLKGAAVPIYAADGEFIIHPDDIVDRFGDVDYGHRSLDAWQTAERKKLIETLEGLAPPAQD